MQPKEKSSQQEQKEISRAYHESGHTMAYCVHKFKIGYISITPDTESAGITQPFWHPDLLNESDSNLLVNRLVRAICGFLSEFRFDHSQNPANAETNLEYVANLNAIAGKDKEQADEVLFHLRSLGRDIEECKVIALNLAGELIDKHWEAIEALATTLVIEKTMDGERVNTILQPFGLSAT